MQDTRSESLPYKLPRSVLVIIHTADLQVLLLRRASQMEGQDYWQPVTGSQDSDRETWQETAVREVFEETGIDAEQHGCVLRDWGLENTYPIYPAWRHRYAPDVCMNTEHVFSLQVPSYTKIVLSPREHTAHAWHHWHEAAQRCYSISNSEAILWLPRFIAA
ncbi:MULTISPECIES: dihydroneopterin triphosphate diphosphatase [Comamonas]|jgi:dATP pyrophosphohydrolase|uniref:Dihydroneopterin triphosphate diphosphatase n=1 Tax=Comamonas squillarum TaxID=2977320 RepID=A0ABY6A798_9BURK|nr:MULTISPECIES: dihydroneopterin triphosphate diphosphatase [Comamonas]PWB16311.1 dihydroneopterin triphosphate diphosphatase [Comamonas sp. JNW]UXC20686.1 dihydroneopterin triphosphate diphosphatase [Comamonas sp. PR12]